MLHMSPDNRPSVPVSLAVPAVDTFARVPERRVFGVDGSRWMRDIQVREAIDRAVAG